MNNDQKTVERKRQREEEDEIKTKVENKKRKVNHRETDENDEKKKQMEIEQEIIKIKDKNEEVLLGESQIKAEKKRKMEEEDELDLIEDQRKTLIPSRLTWREDVIRREALMKAQIDSRNRRRESSPEKNLLRPPSPTYSPDLEIIFEKLKPMQERVFYPTEGKYFSGGMV